VIARAPGKVVLSGAYAVLEGAPAVVAAVDRYAVADAARTSARLTPEVGEALRARGETKAPWFDASALRDEVSGQKLGLGSSAAILVASLAALELATEPGLIDDELARRILPAALAAHRAAQGGGSGIDVAASALGGILRFERKAAGAPPDVRKMTLPGPIFVQVWSSSAAASTSGMLARVAAFRASFPNEHRVLLQRLCEAASAAAGATDGAGFVAACRDQLDHLATLGDLAGAPIVTAETRAFDRALSGERVVLPSGAGGGDVVLLLGTEPPQDDIEKVGRNLGFVPLALALGARGVHAVPRSWQEAGRNDVLP
jgi:phosphomevalonate kinase